MYSHFSRFSRSSGNPVYSGDDAVMMSELLHWYYAARQYSGIGSKSKAVLSVGTSMALLLNVV